MNIAAAWNVWGCTHWTCAWHSNRGQAAQGHGRSTRASWTDGSDREDLGRHGQGVSRSVAVAALTGERLSRSHMRSMLCIRQAVRAEHGPQLRGWHSLGMALLTSRNIQAGRLLTGSGLRFRNRSQSFICRGAYGDSRCSHVCRFRQAEQTVRLPWSGLPSAGTCNGSLESRLSGVRYGRFVIADSCNSSWVSEN